MRRLTTFAMVIALLGGVVGCGSSSGSFSAAEHAWVACNQRQQAANVGGAHPVGAEASACHSLAAKACQAAKRDHATGPGTGLPCEVAEGHYVGPNGGKEEPVTGKEPAAPEREHTPGEEEAHKKSLETNQRIEHESATAKKAVEEDETRGGENSIRAVEEKVCYESGKTSEYCKSPAEKRELENEAVAKPRRVECARYNDYGGCEQYEER
jgi:hypothetical protein